jgi:hypothetical protein
MIRVRNKKIYTHGSLQLLTTEVVYVFSYIAHLFAGAANISYEEAVDKLVEVVKSNGKEVLEDEGI